MSQSRRSNFHRTMTRAIASGEKGMTLIEIIIVMALVGGLMAVIAANVVAGMRRAKESSAQLSFNQLKSTLQIYKMAHQRYPTTEQGLSALVTDPGNVAGWRGPYCEADLLRDPWGTEIQYESDGRKFTFRSAGDDEELGTEDDVVWPAEAKTAAR